MVELGSLHNPITGSSMRRIGKRPGHGPTLRVHGDAHAVLFGNPASFQRDSPEAKPRKTSFASSTARLSCKVSPRLGTTASSPVLISPIRAMRPARQASIRLPPLANASPSRPPPNNDGLVVVSAAANVEVGHNASSRGASVSAPRPLETSNSIQLDVNAPKQTPSFRLRAQRSVRSLFSRKENKPAESRPASVETAQSSIASAGRNLLKRISKNFSKEDLPAVPSVPEAELQNLEELNREQSAARAAYTPTTAPTRVPSPHPAPAPAPVAAPVSISVDTAAIHPETSRIITETVERAGTMPVGARETMLALEIGEVRNCLLVEREYRIKFNITS
ncbi:hypothetical protein DE146DRAFT_143979 [Phaeosphaeria sp. MPI-PUGE-AT-0046c]|nr:hypothetical protein DE146DRAFT_143979 [Phaeosphaeria sp. MPI-PUGE-AT-0046c]